MFVVPPNLEDIPPNCGFVRRPRRFQELFVCPKLTFPQSNCNRTAINDRYYSCFSVSRSMSHQIRRTSIAVSNTSKCLALHVYLWCV